MKIRLLLPAVAILAVACADKPTNQQETTENSSVYLTPEVMCGTVTFKDGCGPSMDTIISFGLALIHHMTYEDAEHNFDQVIARDPDCFWGHWGKAMTYIHPLWSDPPSEERLTRGRVLTQRAQALAQTDREKSYAAALAGYYESQAQTEQDKLAAFHAGWKDAHEQAPDDIEAKLFYGLTKLSVASPGDKSYTAQREVGALAEGVLETVPDHPGGFHYAIHAYDVPALADKALYVANNYGKIAPEIPHALHMPSHIYTRLGHWQESIDWNTRSADVAAKLVVDGKRTMHYFHAMDYIVYACLQQGDDTKAMELNKTVDTLSEEIQSSPATAYALAAMPSRFALERGAWKEASELKVPRQSEVDWSKFPQFEAIVHFAKGIGAARSGNQAVVTEALARLDTLIVKMSASKSYAYWLAQSQFQRQAVEAWSLYQQGKKAEGLALMQKAVEMESATEKHPISPGEIIPIAEMYGDMLLDNGKAAEALVQYRAALTRTPNRLNGLYGAGRAAELSGDKAAMKEYYTALVKIVREGSGREAVHHANKMLKEM